MERPTKQVTAIQCDKVTTKEPLLAPGTSPMLEGVTQSETMTYIVRKTMLGLSHELTGHRQEGGDGTGPWGGLSGRGKTCAGHEDERQHRHAGRIASEAQV